MIEKDMLELCHYTVTIDGLTIIPISMKYDEVNCEITFSVVNKRQFTRTIVRKGKHDNYIFSTSIWKTPFTVNLKTNVIKKIRKLDV